MKPPPSCTSGAPSASQALSGPPPWRAHRATVGRRAPHTEAQPAAPSSRAPLLAGSHLAGAAWLLSKTKALPPPSPQQSTLTQSPGWKPPSIKRPHRNFMLLPDFAQQNGHMSNFLGHPTGLWGAPPKTHSESSTLPQLRQTACQRHRRLPHFGSSSSSGWVS